jgi:nucleoid-associated protein YgaU
MEQAVKQIILTAAVAGLIAVTGCKKNNPPPAPAPQAEIQPTVPPAYIPPSNPGPVTVTPSEPVPVTPVESAPVTQAPAPARAVSGAVRPGTTYTVVRGDSLYSIATRAYGSRNVTTSISAIKRANNLSGDTIRVGQKLKIPARTSGNKD